LLGAGGQSKSPQEGEGREGGKAGKRIAYSELNK